MRISPINRPRVLVTMGDPSGIGPEIIIKSMASPEIKGLAIFIVIGDGGILERTAESLACRSAPINKINLRKAKDEVSLDENAINVIDPTAPLVKTKPGIATDEGAFKALDCLKTAVTFMKDPEDSGPKAMVTAPLSKERTANIEHGFIGHTEYLQKAYSAAFVTMVMKGKALCVVPVTRHIPIKEVVSGLTQKKIENTLKQIIQNRSLLSEKENIRIGVTGLNPHCGEGGKIGDEEERIIEPAIKNIKNIYADIEGPISADVIFNKALEGKIDIVVSMYHDQGLAPFKAVDFDNGVNITLGLGHVRTSPDHGTAFDIAGKGIASSQSMEEAIKLAVRAIKR